MVCRRAGFRYCLVIAALAGCSPDGGAPAQPRQRASAPAAPRRVAPPCPPDHLSCGLQKPVRSDGIHRFVNGEMGVSAIFPPGSQVCLGRSGDAPRGFYAWYGARVQGCPERGDIPATAMGINTSFNALDYTSLRQAAMNCDPLSGKVRRRGGTLGFPGHRSLACQDLHRDGVIEITVYAMAGRSEWSPHAPEVIYFASLTTGPERLDRDLRMFRTFLGRLRIGHVSSR
jgi:hypothetical protein